MPITPAEAQQIATDVIRGQVTERPWFYVVLVAVMFLSGAAGAFLSSYFKKRGEALATKADFEALQDQLRRSTSLVEDVKAEVHSRYGEQAALRALLRERTEQLVMATFELEQWLSQAQARSLRGDPTQFDDSPMSKVSTYRDIYFPEVVAEYDALKDRYLTYASWLIQLQGISLNAQPNPTQFQSQVQAHLNGFRAVYQPFYATLAPFRSRVIEAARARGGL